MEQRRLLELYRDTTAPRRVREAALERLVTTNRPLLVHLVRRWYGPLLNAGAVEFEDVMQEAQMGLVEGLRRFDLSRDVNVMSYATHWARSFAQRAVDCTHRGRACRVPGYVVGRARHVARLVEELGLDPNAEDTPERVLGAISGMSVDELPATLHNVTLDDVESALRVRYSTVSLPRPRDCDDEGRGTRLARTIEAALSRWRGDEGGGIDDVEEGHDLDVVRRAVARSLGRLAPDELRVLATRMGYDPDARGSTPPEERPSGTVPYDRVVDALGVHPRTVREVVRSSLRAVAEEVVRSVGSDVDPATLASSKAFAWVVADVLGEDHVRC